MCQTVHLRCAPTSLQGKGSGSLEIGRESRQLHLQGKQADSSSQVGSETLAS